MRTIALTLIGALAVSGCDRANPPRDPVAPQAGKTEAVSIIRPDIEVERQAPPLAPLSVRIGFPDGGTKLSPADLAALATVLESPQVAAGGALMLRGHTDSSGHDEANLRASQKRAEAVRDWLVEHGIDEARIAVAAMGEQNPIAPNALPDGSPNEAGRAANRRVELTVAVPAGTPLAQPTGEPETLVDELSNSSPPPY